MKKKASNSNNELSSTFIYAAEQKARTTYEQLMKQTDDPDVLDPLRFLRQREVIHYQRFGEALNDVNFLKDRKKVF